MFMSRRVELDLHGDTKFIVAIENLHGIESLGDNLTAADEDAINIEGEDEGVGNGGFQGRGDRCS